MRGCFPSVGSSLFYSQRPHSKIITPKTHQKPQKENANYFIIKQLAFQFVPLTDEILNLWNDFLEIVDYLQSTPQISKIIESI